MPTGGFYIAGGVVNGILYVLGATTGPPSALVEAYDPLADTWTTASPMPTARTALAAAVVNGVLYAVGGAGGGPYLATNEAFTPPITPAEADQNLINTINSMTLPAGSKTSLTAPLTSALNRLSDNNPTNDIAACNDLGAFINQVSAKQKAGKLTAEQAAELTSAAQAIQGALECP
jgi:hypothetical protein